MTQGELQALLDSLWWWLDTLRRDGRRDNREGEWLSRLPYQLRVVKEFVQRVQMDLYGEIKQGVSPEASPEKGTDRSV